MKTRHLWLLPLLALVACSGDADPLALARADVSPAVQGLTLRDEDSLTLGVWRSPPDGGAMAFPNPCSGRVSFRFEMEQAGPVRVDVLAMGLEMETSPGTLTGGLAVVTWPQARIRSFPPLVVPAGTSEVMWDVRDDQDRPMPDGFYRLRAITPNAVAFDDVYVYRSGFPAPPADLLRLLDALGCTPF